MLTHFRADNLLGSLHQLNSAIGMMEGVHVPRYGIAAAKPQSGGYKSSPRTPNFIAEAFAES